MQKYGVSFLLAISFLFSSLFTSPMVFADENEYGQVIQIYTRFHSYIGKPRWVLIIRDVDNNRVYPYTYDIRRGTNYWVAFSHSRNYLITTSRIHSGSYRSAFNDFREYTLENVCHLESQGRIIRDQSLYITIQGDVTPDADTLNCQVSRYANSNFVVAQPAEVEEPAETPAEKNTANNTTPEKSSAEKPAPEKPTPEKNPAENNTPVTPTPPAPEAEKPAEANAAANSNNTANTNPAVNNNGLLQNSTSSNSEQSK